MKDYQYRHRCSYCGKFVPWSVKNVFIYFGSPTDIEPLEEEYICDKCVKESKARLIEEKYIPNCYWLNPVYLYEVADAIGWIYDGNSRSWKKEI